MLKVEWQDGRGDTPKAVELIEEALQIAESRYDRVQCHSILDYHYVSLASSHGADSEQVGGLLVALAGMVVEERGVGEGGRMEKKETG